MLDRKQKDIRACWDFAFGANAAKFSAEQGAMREHSRSYATEEQHCAVENLASAARKVKSQQALKNLEVSAGLLAGYIAAGFLNMLFFDKNWGEAFSDQKLLVGFAGIALSVILIVWTKRKRTQNEGDQHPSTNS